MLSGCFGDSSFSAPPYKRINEHVPPKPPIQKQGILSILPSDHHSHLSSIPNNSIRRTLSADHMSSQKWLHQNGFPSSPSMKRAQSSEQLQALGEEGGFDHDHDHHTKFDSSNDDNKGAFEDIWSSIQADKKTWGSILSPQKNEGSGSGSGSGQVPYVHPLVRRSSSLSEKSLEICTESLGSETGSDGFSLYPGSEPEDSEKDGEDQPAEEQEELGQDLLMSHDNNNNVGGGVVEEMKEYVELQGKYNNNKNNYNKYPPNYKKVSSFPPPLPSLAHRDGSNLHMRPHRQGGRLVLEAVSVPSQNCFRAQRHDGRLLLTLANEAGADDEADVLKDEEDLPIENHGAEDDVEVVDDYEEDEEEASDDDEDEVEEMEEILMDQKASMVNVHSSSSTLMIMRKLMELTSTRNKSTWPRNFNTTVVKSLEEEDDQEVDEEEDTIPLKPRMARLISAAAGPRSTATAALNAYEYYWRRESEKSAATAVALLKPLAGQHHHQTKVGVGGAPQVGRKESNNNRLLLGHNEKSVAQQQEMVLVKAAGAGEKAEYLVPFLRGCKEPSKSLLFWEPYCIATS